MSKVLKTRNELEASIMQELRALYVDHEGITSVEVVEIPNGEDFNWGTGYISAHQAAALSLMTSERL